MQLVIPNSALRYILWQRTEYQKIYSNPMVQRLERIAHLPLQRRVVTLETRLFRAQIKRAFNNDMNGEFAEIRDHLPTQPTAMLDIGCGVAGIDAFIYQHYAAPLVVYLLDKTTIDTDIHYGFEQSGSFYNSLSEARHLLTLNGVPAEQVHLREATPDNRIEVPEPLDLIISLISWGFHYPLATYLAPAYDLLKPGGRLILDIRQGTGEEQALRDRFASVELIATHPRSFRLLAVK